MKASPLLVGALALAGCMIGSQIVTGATPVSPGDTFVCMSHAVTALGYTITTSDKTTGFLAAEKVDPTVPDSAEFSELSVSIYTDRDGHTQYMITPGRSRRTADGQRQTLGLVVQQGDDDAASAVAKQCKNG